MSQRFREDRTAVAERKVPQELVREAYPRFAITGLSALSLILIALGFSIILQHPFSGQYTSAWSAVGLVIASIAVLILTAGKN